MEALLLPKRLEMLPGDGARATAIAVLVNPKNFRLLHQRRVKLEAAARARRDHRDARVSTEDDLAEEIDSHFNGMERHAALVVY